MKNNLNDLYKNLSDNPQNFSTENIENLVNDSLEFFNHFREVANSGTSEEQEKATIELIEFHKTLRTALDKFADKLGISPSQLYDFSANQANFTKDQWAIMQSINNKFTKFNTSFLSDINASKKTQPKAGRALKEQQITI